MSTLNTVSVIASLGKAAGGPTFSVVALSEAIAKAGVKQSLFTVQASSGQAELIPHAELVETLRIPGSHFPRLRISWSPSFASRLRSYCLSKNVQIIHCHGIWTQPNHQAARVAGDLKLPLVITTHGMLAPWAFSHKAWKKRLAWRLYQSRDLKSAALFQATAKHEARDIRNLGFTQPIAVIPNGVDVPDWRRPTNGKEPRTVLFLGRIYPVKGLLNLVAAWGQLRPSGWRCVIAGPDENGHMAEVQSAIKAAGLESKFIFSGNVESEGKWDLYRSADLFVLPSFTENFGLVVAEALASGIPVITTKGTRWEDLQAHKCGWWVDIGPEPLAAALREAMSLTDQERQEMGIRGHHMIKEAYGWNEIGKKITSVYEWMLGRGPQPPCVDL